MFFVLFWSIQQFPAHPGWYKNQEIHYYKFRMYTPTTYPGLISPGVSSTVVPIGKVWLTTTDGGFDGVVGNPICEFHTNDGNDYSDFVELSFVTGTYVADTYKSVGDVTESDATMQDSGIIVNMPVVPINSTLQDPANKDLAAPIDPVMCWYKGVKIQTFVFEFTDQAAATFFANTRRGDISFNYAIPVEENYATPSRVSSIPLWHINQFTRGVTPGEGGGPSPNGQRNIINLDRGDPGYSPLWDIFWVTEVPINYVADEVSISSDFTSSNGFVVLTGLPMFVNCPNIGAVGSENVMRREEEHEQELDLTNEMNWVMGSAMSLIMQGNVPVSLQLPDGTEIATTQTNGMGAYELELASSDVPGGTTALMVIAKGDNIRNITVRGTAASINGGTSAGVELTMQLAVWMGAISTVVGSLF